jgi:hypothetical protein
MANYMTRYDQTKKVELNDGFWVEVKVCLTGTEKRRLEAMRITYGVEKVPGRMGAPERTQAVITKIDPDKYLYELAIASIVDWNLPGGDDQAPGDKWPLSPDKALRSHYDLLDTADQDAIEAACNEDNAEPTKEDDARFLGEGERGLPAGEDEGAGDSQVLAGAGLLEEAGDSDRRAPVG